MILIFRTWSDIVEKLFLTMKIGFRYDKNVCLSTIDKALIVFHCSRRHVVAKSPIGRWNKRSISAKECTLISFQFYRNFFICYRSISICYKMNFFLKKKILLLTSAWAVFCTGAGAGITELTIADKTIIRVQNMVAILCRLTDGTLLPPRNIFHSVCSKFFYVFIKI